MSLEKEKRDAINKILKNKKLTESLEKFGTVTSIQPDEDIVGATTGQALLLLRGIPTLTPQLTDAVSYRTNGVAIKLNALRYHCKKYEEIQKLRLNEILLNELLCSFIKKGYKICELEMLYEVEAFFFQYKSSLDMLVKILCPLTGLNSGSLSTYGNYGEKIIKTLNNLKKNRKLNLTLGRVNWLIEEIEKTKSLWLESVIKLRDTISHYRSDITFGFEWDNEVGRIRVPSSETNKGYQPFYKVMEELTESLINYSANFTAIAVSCAFPLSTGIQVMDDMEKRYIGARWQMNLNRAIWKLGSNVIRDFTEDDIESAKKLAEEENK